MLAASQLEGVEWMMVHGLYGLHAENMQKICVPGTLCGWIVVSATVKYSDQ